MPDNINNNDVWNKIYETTDFGNRYPSSYLISLFFNVIKKNVKCDKIKVLDFGCSFGANSRMLKDFGCDVYGIDISSMAIQKCIENGMEANKFVATNILEDDMMTLKDFEQFDVIIASECLYYFIDEELKKLMIKFKDMLKKDGIIYGNYPTFNHTLYKAYADEKPDRDGMITVKQSGKANEPLRVKILKCKSDIKEIFEMFDPILITRTIEEVYGDNEEIHFIGRNV